MKSPILSVQRRIHPESITPSLPVTPLIPVEPRHGINHVNRVQPHFLISPSCVLETRVHLAAAVAVRLLGAAVISVLIQARRVGPFNAGPTRAD